MHANYDSCVSADNPYSTSNLDELTKVSVQRELDQILVSPTFRNSPRCKTFLSFVVGRALEGRDEDLKERAIGVALFGRSPSYGTAEDSIVRVSASEVRRRLAQYYAENTTGSALRIDLPVGSYVPTFKWNPSASATKRTYEMSSHLRQRPTIFLVVVISLAIAALVIGWRDLNRPVVGARSHPSLVRNFWAPVLSNSHRVLICLASPTIYGLSSRATDLIHIRQRQSQEQQNQQVVSMLPNLVPRRDIIPLRDQYVPEGDALAAADLSALFTGMAKPWELRIIPGLSFADLRSSPAVLLGAFNNSWTLQMTSGLRYGFTRHSGHLAIKDLATPGRFWTPTVAPSGDISLDYALVSRILLSKTGQPLIIMAGISRFGTWAAGNLTTSNEELAAALRHAPKRWQDENLELLIETHVIESTPGPPIVIGVHSWPPDSHQR